MAWADYYVSFAGLLHREAANVILTRGFPSSAPDLVVLWDLINAFHSYPHEWYKETIQTDVSPMGFRWSFERGGFAAAPPPSEVSGKVFLQPDTGSEWNLSEITYDEGTNRLNERLSRYRLAALFSGAQTIAPGLSSGNVFGISLYGAPADVNLILHLITSISGGSLSPNSAFRPQGRGPAGPTGTNVPAYAWIPLTVPLSTVSMSFDFLVEGDGQNDSFVAALNGTNVLSVQLSLIQT